MDKPKGLPTGPCGASLAFDKFSKTESMYDTENIVPLRQRIDLVAQNLHPSRRGRYQYLESRTGIKASSWQNIFRTGPKATQPTGNMLEALARAAPHFAFWLVTGFADAESGHYDPRDPLATPWRTEAQ